MIKTLLTAALAAGGFAAHASSDQQSYELVISAPVLNTSLPSASGLTSRGKFFQAVGDDSPWLFELDKNFNITNKQLIKEYPLDANGRIQKKVKPDYEAMAQVRVGKELWRIVLGSGSKADVREWGYLLSSDRSTKVESSLKPLYAQLYAASGFSGAQTLNIEGLATDHEYAYIFNRGNSGSNVIFRVRLAELLEYMHGKITQVSKVEAFKVKLPSVSNFEAGLSGADYWPQTRSLVYTASVEATGDAYNDGAILGSFVGVIPLKALKALQPGEVLDLTPSSVALLRDGRAVITKVESIAISHSDDDEINGALVSDNDDGTSEFFNFQLEIKD